MPQQIAAIIAALETALAAQEEFDEDEYVKADIVNRWIRIAPLPDEIKSNLVLAADIADDVENNRLMAHIETVLSYFQTLLEHQQNGTPEPLEGEIISPSPLSLTRK